MQHSVATITPQQSHNNNNTYTQNRTIQEINRARSAKKNWTESYENKQQELYEKQTDDK